MPTRCHVVRAHRNVGAGKAFSFQCPELLTGDKLACQGVEVEAKNGLCIARVAGCEGPNVEVDANGDCAPTRAGCVGKLVEEDGQGGCRPK